MILTVLKIPDIESKLAHPLLCPLCILPNLQGVAYEHVTVYLEKCLIADIEHSHLLRPISAVVMGHRQGRFFFPAE